MLDSDDVEEIINGVKNTTYVYPKITMSLFDDDVFEVLFGKK
jgi:hypothetical protein